MRLKARSSAAGAYTAGIMHGACTPQRRAEPAARPRMVECVCLPRTAWVTFRKVGTAGGTVQLSGFCGKDAAPVVGRVRCWWGR